MGAPTDRCAHSFTVDLNETL